ncbi:MAG: hypothetical protein LBC42_00035 [Puniceicoccales bacterium]|jgi:hypothetical protein|nr:hypothetical protein [Puniceicoccales bacterium]
MGYSSNAGRGSANRGCGSRKDCCREGVNLCCCGVSHSICSVEEKCTQLARENDCGKVLSCQTIIAGVGKLTIVAKIDVGYGNWLTIRGRGAGLTWDKGQVMKNEGPNRWSWGGFSLEGGIEFKVLINDRQWECGCNHTCCGGARLEIAPKFCSCG